MRNSVESLPVIDIYRSGFLGEIQVFIEIRCIFKNSLSC